MGWKFVGRLFLGWQELIAYFQFVPDATCSPCNEKRSLIQPMREYENKEIQNLGENGHSSMLTCNSKYGVLGQGLKN